MNTSSISVSLTRQMLWKMLGADHPMEAHKIDSRFIYELGKGNDAKEWIPSLRKDPGFFQTVSKDMPEYYPWWDERSLVKNGKKALNKLIKLLDLEHLEEMFGQSENIGGPRVFGGQVIGQALTCRKNSPKQKICPLFTCLFSSTWRHGISDNL